MDAYHKRLIQIAEMRYPNAENVVVATDEYAKELRDKLFKLKRFDDEYNAYRADYVALLEARKNINVGGI